MNKERLLQLADTVEKDFLEINNRKIAVHMGIYIKHRPKHDPDYVSVFESFDDKIPDRHKEAGHACDTLACMAGLAIILFERDFASSSVKDMQDRAAELLDLEPYKASALFRGNYSEEDSKNITGAEAARAIRHYVETGQIDWARARHPDLYE